MAPSERTPLLSGVQQVHPAAVPNGKDTQTAPRSGPWMQHLAVRLRDLLKMHVEKRILFAGFLITLSFSFTQVPIFYVFHLMECDVFYENNPPYEGTGDRCSRNEIAAGTATQFSILGMSTTFCGTINLFVAGWMAKRFGPRAALMVQTLVPAIRVATQILGVLAGGEAGIIIFQCTQLITIIGGPVGYILVANVITGELVEPFRRTAVFGMLQGCIMLGQGIGYLSGGMIGDAWGIRRPFEVAFCSFLLSTLYVRIAVPYIAPESLSAGSKPNSKALAEFLSPLRVLAPQKVFLETGVVRSHYGVLFLCAGVFLGVLATGYAPLLVQMFATAVFEFQQGDNGWLMSGFAFMRAVFLIFLFPRIISSGRRWYLARGQEENTRETEPLSPSRLATNPEELEVPVGSFAEEEPVGSAEVEDEGTAFDLFFLRISLVVDGVLTMCAAFATKSWHIYLASFLLPFASGSAPAAKGVMTEMCSASRRADALNALTLVENIARLATQGLFGFAFAALAQIGKPHLTFFANAAIALLAAGVLLFSRFPPEGSRLVESENIAGCSSERQEPGQSHRLQPDART
ncbi:major facilitator superfamily domain-containing protein [Parachaetomium inaequale]|uniref:Major facilitator superfamily domain-containing protein n=1 Tax=Parachaetomium inaequale TaxID=2588326 RepID=A0AAN6P4G9_9PEZI|nr:major facilitator superfamily domain-containing protein [Parachaetomium inaequale]